MEIWLDIKGYEGLYQVSNHGRVRSLNYWKTGKVKILSPSKDKDGYFQVVLCKNGKRKGYRVHRLVAEAFVPNWFNDPQINHIDENKENNNVDNLEWCDCKYNINYGKHNDRVSESKSKPVLQFTKTGEFVREWSSTMEVGRNGFTQQQVSNCCNGIRQSHKGYIWKFKEVV